MDDIKDVGLRAVFQGVDKFLAQTKSVDAAVASMGRKLTGAAATTAGMTGAIGNATRGLTGLLDPLQKVGFAVFGVQQLAQSFTMLGSAILGPSSAWEQYEISFTTLLKSADKAEAKLAEFEAFAAKTPFTLPQVVDASKQMVAYGFSIDEVVPKLTAIGDASAALGSETFPAIVRALGQMRVTTKVNAQDMLQLTSAGVNAWQYLADAIGVSTKEVRELSEQGVLPAEAAIEAIIQGMTKQFGGLGVAQSKSLQGILSNLEDFSFKARRALFGGVFEGLKEVLGGGLEALTQPAVMDTFTNIGKTLGEFASKAIELGRDVLPIMGDALGELGRLWESMGEKAWTALAGVGILFMARGPIMAGIGLAFKGIIALTTAFSGFGLKIIGLIALATALGAAFEAMVFSINAGSFEGFADRFESNMKRVGADIELMTNEAIASMTGDKALSETARSVYNAKMKAYDAEGEVIKQQVNEKEIAKEITSIFERLAEIQEKRESGEGQLDYLNAVEASYKQRLRDLMEIKAVQAQQTAEAQAGFEVVNSEIAKMGDLGGMSGDAIKTKMKEAADALGPAFDTAFDWVKGTAFDTAVSIGDYFTDTMRTVLGNIRAAASAAQAQPSMNAWGSYAESVDAVIIENARYAEELSKTTQQAGFDWKNYLSNLGSTGGATSAASAAIQSLEAAIRDCTSAMEALSNVRLPGMQAAEDDIFDLEMQIKRARLQELGLGDAIQDAAKEVGQGFDMLSAQEREIAEGIPVALQKWEYDMQKAAQDAERAASQAAQDTGGGEKESQRLERLREAKQLMYDLTYEPQLRKLRETYETLSGANREITFEEALKGMLELGGKADSMKKQLALLTSETGEQTEQYETQEQILDRIYGNRTNQLTAEGLIGGAIDANNEKLAEQLRLTGLISQTGGTNPEPFSLMGQIPGMAEGGTAGRSGMFRVGERGPETVFLPQNSVVLPHTARVPQAVSRSETETFNIYGASQPVDIAMAVRREMAFQRLRAGRN